MAKLCLLFVSVFVILGSSWCFRSVQKTRKEKLLFPYIVTIVAGPCHSASRGYYGTCYSSYECSRRGGVASGKCAKNYGVCCVGMVTCNDQVVLNDTYFQNQDYPSPTTGSGECAVTVRKLPGICQIRLDFDEFYLPYPSKEGVCENARFAVTVPGNSNYNQSPDLCGQFRGQHMYVDFDGSDYIKLSYMGTGPKMWKTRIQMIECTSSLKAPHGCRQYYYGSSAGRVEILGYNPKQPPHLANLKYTVCVRQELGKSDITWEVCSQNVQSFSMSADATVPPSFIYHDIFCEQDYIQILGRTMYKPGVYADNVFCGTIMNPENAASADFKNVPITTATTPFLINVETDDQETIHGDMGNVGFCLTYKQT